MTKKPKILIVDDDPVLPIVLADMFAKKNYDVHITSDVNQARSSLQIFQPDLCLLDLKMPGESGLELIPNLISKNPEVKIVVLTGHASIETAVQAIKLGAVYYLEKPADADDILEAFQKNEHVIKTINEVGIKPLEDLFEREKQHVLITLKKHQNNISQTAQALGIHRRTLQRKMKKFGLS